MLVKHLINTTSDFFAPECVGLPSRLRISGSLLTLCMLMADHRRLRARHPALFHTVVQIFFVVVLNCSDTDLCACCAGIFGLPGTSANIIRVLLTLNG